MTDIISKLYYGEVRPCESQSPDTERYTKNRENIQNTEEKLIEKFPDCKELLDSYTEALRIETQLECEADFESGFILGARLAIEILNNIYV